MSSVTKVWMVAVGYNGVADVSFYAVDKLNEIDKQNILSTQNENSGESLIYDLNKKYTDDIDDVFPNFSPDAEIEDLVNTPIQVVKSFYFRG